MSSGGMEASLCSCNYEPFELYRVTEPVARKPHRCCECGGTIQPGEKYERADTRFEGFFESFTTCLPCSQIRRDYCAPYRGLREVIWEHLETDYVTGKAMYE